MVLIMSNRTVLIEHRPASNFRFILIIIKTIHKLEGCQRNTKTEKGGTRNMIFVSQLERKAIVDDDQTERPMKNAIKFTSKLIEEYYFPDII